MRALNGPSRRRPKNVGWRGIVLATLTLALACTPIEQAIAGDSISGSALDADTNEPIVGAWVFEALRDPGHGADVFRVESAEITRTDADGRFSFDGRRSLFGERYPPLYQLYHPSYGLIRGRADGEARTVDFRASLRDSHLRRADATAFCNARADDAMTAKMKSIACPPVRALRFEDGSPTATGALDEKGRRVGEWTFFREDGSTIARGYYAAGAATGTWHFEPPAADDDVPE